jgi:NAD dependent epimerase/dehydratase
MVWQGKRVLVTGAGGFIGSHLVERLVREGASTRAMVRYTSHGLRGWLEESPAKDAVEVVYGDVTDRDSVQKAVSGCEVVFHLAGLVSIPFSYQTPHLYIRTNIEGTLNVLLAARETKVACLVHTSTAEVYGTARHVPVDESHPLQGQSPYSTSKIAADKLVEAFQLSFGVRCVTVRPFNTYGPRQSARAVIPTIITQALAGTDIRLGSLSPLRDFTYVEDTVDGFVRAAGSPAALGAVVNLGTGREIDIGSLAHLICSIAGSRAKILADPERLRPTGSEVERLCADNRKAHALLSWTPAWSLERGLAASIEWTRSNLSKYRPGEYSV